MEEKTVKSLVEESKKSDLTLAGKVMANNTNKIKLNSDKGMVKDVLVKEGDHVEKGQPLFTYQTDQQIKAKEAELDTQAKARAVEIAKSSAGIKWSSYNKKAAQLNQAKVNYNKENTEDLKNDIKTFSLDNSIEKNTVAVSILVIIYVIFIVYLIKIISKSK